MLTILSVTRIDIDLEYPTASQKADFVRLVRELRQGLDHHARKKREYFLLSDPFTPRLPDIRLDAQATPYPTNCPLPCLLALRIMSTSTSQP